MPHIISTGRTTVLLRALILILSFAFGIWVIWGNSVENPNILRWNSWAFYEWLINYESGFVRRGLVGAIIVKLFYGNEVFAINLLVFIMAASFFCLAHIFIYKHTTTCRAVLIYIFSPIGIYWIAIGNEYYYRKEILFLLALISICLFFCRIKKTGGKLGEKALCLAIIVLDVVLPLVHEAFLFFNGLVFLLVLLALNAKDPTFRRLTVWLHIGLCLAIFIVLSFYKGDSTASTTIWNSLSTTALMNGGSEPSGAIAAIGWSFREALKLSILALASGLGSYYLWSLVVTYLVVGFITAEQRRISLLDFYTSKELISTFGSVCLTFLPLFALGWDWGRWVFGIAYASLFILILKLEDPIVQYWQSQHSRFRLGKLQGSFCAFVVILLIGFFTRMPECCFTGSGASLLSNPALSGLKSVLSGKRFIDP
jgi:hypothetical protein